MVRVPPELIGGIDSRLGRCRRAIVMAPHPDDFDVIAVTLRRMMEGGAEIHVAVMTSGASGVDDAGLSRECKACLREREQEASCRFFGLPASRLRFLRLDEDGGHLAESDANEEVIRAQLESVVPDVVFMPHHNDPNLAHQRTNAMVRRALARLGLRALIALNRDPKTIEMHVTAATTFGEDEAEWKRMLLRHHESQQRRNLRTRGKGLDDRILELNAADGGPRGGYAEVFEVLLP